MIATAQKENFNEEIVTEKFSIISNLISNYRLKPRDYAVYCCLVKHSDKKGERQAVHMHYLPFSARLNKCIIMVTQLILGFSAHLNQRELFPLDRTRGF